MAKFDSSKYDKDGNYKATKASRARATAIGNWMSLRKSMFPGSEITVNDLAAQLDSMIAKLRPPKGSISGFMIFQNGKPLAIDLPDDLQSEVTVSPFPVFSNQVEAEECLTQQVGLSVNFRGGEIVPVTINVGAPIQTQEQILAERGLVQNEDGTVNEIENEIEK